MQLFAVLIGIILTVFYRFLEILELTLIKSVLILCDVHKVWQRLGIGPTRGIRLPISMYSGPLTYELNSFPRTGRKSSLFFP